MEIKQETVTLSLDTYKGMERELKTLRMQVQQKTIYRDPGLSPIYGCVAIIILMGFHMWSGF
jgi:hypothetical protein|tara:strand:+ start:62 stop:247 length:186 start_codon:yes stop_codon:yes gene_type:complete